MVPNDTGVVAVFRNGTVKNSRASQRKQDGRSMTTSRWRSFAIPARRDYRRIPCDGAFALGCRSVHRRAARLITYAERFSKQYQQFKAQQQQTKSGHAARLPAVPHRGQTRRASCDEHLHCGGAGDCRRLRA